MLRIYLFLYEHFSSSTPMSTITENIDNLTTEELLGPPKYDTVGLFMVFLSALITGVIA